VFSTLKIIASGRIQGGGYGGGNAELKVRNSGTDTPRRLSVLKLCETSTKQRDPKNQSSSICLHDAWNNI
jgi:hypothetical protein